MILLHSFCFKMSCNYQLRITCCLKADEFTVKPSEAHYYLLELFIRILIKQIYKFIQPAYSKANRGGLYDLQ